jgi:hypothetical protein
MIAVDTTAMDALTTLSKNRIPVQTEARQQCLC